MRLLTESMQGREGIEQGRDPSMTNIRRISPIPRALLAGNWKMNGLRKALGELDAMAAAYDPPLRSKLDLLICPPATLLAQAAQTLAGAPIALGGQDCHIAASGAFTGDLSAEMLADAGASFVICGHSERRIGHGETSALVKAKAAAARRAGLTAIVCVGESRAERDAGKAMEAVRAQLDASVPEGADAADALVIAYEPVWAIGAGQTPSAADIAAVHAMIRDELMRRMGTAGAAVRILYGGSVKPSNAAELMAIANVDGALVGGASLTAAEFMAIADVYR